jgi:hypothetical protein
MGLFLEIHPVLLPMKWLIYRAGPYGRLARRILRWAERTESLWVASECYAYLFWEAYYAGVFPARGADAPDAGPVTARASRTGASSVGPSPQAPLPEAANVEP